MAKGKGKRKIGAGDVASNRAASHRFNLLDRVECGIVLKGTELSHLLPQLAALALYAAAMLGLSSLRLARDQG